GRLRPDAGAEPRAGARAAPGRTRDHPRPRTPGDGAPARPGTGHPRLRTPPAQPRDPPTTRSPGPIAARPPGAPEKTAPPARGGHRRRPARGPNGPATAPDGVLHRDHGIRT